MSQFLSVYGYISCKSPSSLLSSYFILIREENSAKKAYQESLNFSVLKMLVGKMSRVTDTGDSFLLLMSFSADLTRKVQFVVEENKENDIM